MVFGLHNEREDLPARINELMVSIGQKPCTQDCVRLRTILKAVMRSSGSLQLKGNFKNVYISPNRTCEEQSAHEQFVKEMKIPIQSDPNNYHYIRNG